MNFEFATATRIYVGQGVSTKVGTLTASMGSRALLVLQNAKRAAFLEENLKAAGVEVARFEFSGEPTVDGARAGRAAALAHDADVVIGFGGGSALDMGKAIAALATNPGDPLDYLEIIGRGQSLTQPPLAYIAVPTTAGTGAEVTANAVLASPADSIKVSLRGPWMLPRAALIDPALTRSMTPEVTAYTGMDALTQVIEPFVTHKSNPITDALCRDGIGRIARSLPVAFQQPDRAGAREDMAIGALLGGMALANAKLGAVHGFAGPIGGMFDAPHGAVCAALLPIVMHANIAAMLAREPSNPALRRYEEVARILTGNAVALAVHGAAWVTELAESLTIPKLAHWGVDVARVNEIAEKAASSSSMSGNPVTLTPDELRSILLAAL